MTRLLIALCLAAQPLHAEPLAKLELNTLEQTDQACRVTFTGFAETAIDALVVETVLFDGAGAVSLLTLFDFGALPPRKFRVRQFDLPQTDCTDISRILFNGIDSCEGAACPGALSATSRLETVEVLG